ncbi:MAG: hypothetical protein OER21_02145 [Gemmatimonadota bacterium]|nr:hypothetical protein [Gemmatimonadota bacterium]
MKKLLGYLWATGFVAWIAYATVRWVRESDGWMPALTHLWETLHVDWMLLLIVTDLLVFTIFAIAWLVVDLRRHGASAGRIAAWIGPLFVFGNAVLVVYLLRRPRASHG